jgi:hypothetical protein
LKTREAEIVPLIRLAGRFHPIQSCASLRRASLDKIRKAPEFVQFMTELKATVDGYRSEFESR